ncbi:carbohydrate ABC transporter permease [Salipiger sp. 1_MG-2023]|uniref:carbohydrate ABC transporter permease n=1 Tax=Salipiger sp. 1_MG-2023 TaxID=3062665 RepID=UPI0026E2AE49|nr:carbohydrate ABC transporter permease [Salipiger sp. 1_MG-2023]MDO6585914.1 carbohydrate ABC transporter permease [Salipiger sp. 1_MG-2023]
MDNLAGQKTSLSIVTNLAVIFLVVIWMIPTVGLLVSSFRERAQISETGWWESLFPVEAAVRVRPSAAGAGMDGAYGVLTGNLFEGGTGSVSAFGLIGREPGAAKVGETYAWYEVTITEDGALDDERIEIAYPAGEEPQFPDTTADGLPITPGSGVLQRSLTVAENGDFTYIDEGEISRDPSIYVVTTQPPDFGLQNYQQILTSDGMDRAFINTLTVTVPATVIPILIAAFAAYALAWMEFPGKGWLVAAVVGLLVVPLQLALVPMLTLHNKIGIGQSFLGIWMAHTGFGLPLAVYLLRNYMIGLPRDIIESAKVDGATDFQVFTKIVLPLSFPALASFAIFQFLWTWNDLLVAKVFLPAGSDSWVMTVKIADDLLGSRGGDWGILAAAAFVSIAVPLLVFFFMQKYLVRGLLAGSVK